MRPLEFRYPGTLEVVCDRSMVADLDPADLLEIYVDLSMQEAAVWAGVLAMRIDDSPIPCVVAAQGSRAPTTRELSAFTDRWSAWVRAPRSGSEPTR